MFSNLSNNKCLETKSVDGKENEDENEEGGRGDKSLAGIRSELETRGRGICSLVSLAGSRRG